jgi:hypothetical protein
MLADIEVIRTASKGNIVATVPTGVVSWHRMIASLLRHQMFATPRLHTPSTRRLLANYARPIAPPLLASALSLRLHRCILKEK